MATDDNAPSARLRWARLRFQILGPLLAAPADDGELKTRIAELAARPWRNPTTGESVRFSFKTIERWWYTARGVDEPSTSHDRVGRSRPKTRSAPSRSAREITDSCISLWNGRRSDSTRPDRAFSTGIPRSIVYPEQPTAAWHVHAPIVG